MSRLSLEKRLVKLYGTTKGKLAFDRIISLMDDFSKKSEKYQESFSPAEIVLITYGDSIFTQSHEPPLHTLHQFCNRHLKDLFSTIHILPFYPYSSDDGFSVKDFHAVDESLGSWQEVQAIGKEFHLMFDFVLNHISAESDWFKRYLAEQEEFRDLAIEVDPATDLSRVTRPRSLPLLTTFTKKSGKEVHLWTTFSEDQVDLNFASIDVLIKMVEVLLHYVRMGATILRLDAIAYLWKEIGTPCVHLEQTHDIVKLFRSILDQIAPEVLILTETNVPHQENISYFGSGNDEAQMVYNFTLPPLLLYTFHNENSELLSDWAATLSLDSPTNTFFNFTASHDGIGVRPLEGILKTEEIQDIISVVKKNGGKVSYKRNSDGSDSPYELNITYVDAYLKSDGQDDNLHSKRFLASQAIQLVLPGVPAIYIHSLLGTRNWIEGVNQTGRARTINRRKLVLEELENELSDPESFRSSIFYPYLEMIRTRKNQPAFHPKSGFDILKIHQGVFAIKRYCDQQIILCLTNITAEKLQIDTSHFDLPKKCTDILSGKPVAYTDKSITLNPYQSCWLTANLF